MGRVSLRDDVVLRAIHKLVAALLRAAGLRQKKDIPGAEQSLGDGLGAIGLPLTLLTTLDSTTLRGLIPDDERRALIGAALVELGQLRNDSALEEKGNTILDDIDVESLPDDVRAAVIGR